MLDVYRICENAFSLSRYSEYYRHYRDFGLFGSCDLELDPMTFIYELDLYCMQVYCICKYELLTSRLSKVII